MKNVMEQVHPAIVYNEDDTALKVVVILRQGRLYEIFSNIGVNKSFSSKTIAKLSPRSTLVYEV